MTIREQTFSRNFSHPTHSESHSQAVLGDFHPRHHDTHAFLGDSSGLAVFGPPMLTDPADLAASEKTRAALLKLADSPRDTLALAALWDENRASIENEIFRHLHSHSNSPLVQQLLARLVWHARFFCDEVDDPQAWVARCANLETRRLALKSTTSR